MDSPLNKAGLLQVYIHTTQNILIEINPQTRIPRTFPRFAGLMVQLLHKLSIRATNGSEKLLKVIKNPITDHFPPGCRKIGTSYSSKKLVDIEDYVKANFKEEPVVFVIGAFAHGNLAIFFKFEI
jgi:rRNA small subunit pseudouridine methyltransferase Nep1